MTVSHVHVVNVPSTFREPGAWDSVTWCYRCGKWWADSSRTQVSCAVNHGANDCCHYGMTEVRLVPVPKDTP